LLDGGGHGLVGLVYSGGIWAKHTELDLARSLHVTEQVEQGY